MARFNTDTRAGQFFGNLGASVVFLLAVGVVFGAIAFVVIQVASSMGVDLGIDPSEVGIWTLLMGAGFGLYIGLIFAILFYVAGARNIAFNATTLQGGHRLESNVGRLRYIWILISNLFVTMLTLGLMLPWAAIRTWNYLTGATAFHSAGDMDRVVDTATPDGNVAAAEFFDIEGIDFGL